MQHSTGGVERNRLPLKMQGVFQEDEYYSCPLTHCPLRSYSGENRMQPGRVRSHSKQVHPGEISNEAEVKWHSKARWKSYIKNCDSFSSGKADMHRGFTDKLAGRQLEPQRLEIFELDKDFLAFESAPLSTYSDRRTVKYARPY